jgi:flagellar motor protein MotB
MKKNLISVALLALMSGCAHPQTAPPTCPPCETQTANLEAEREIERLNKETRDYSEKLERLETANAYMDRWRQAFEAMRSLIRDKLTPTEAVDEEGEPIQASEGSDDLENLEYKIDFLSGNLQLTFSNDVFFKKGKPGITPEGHRVIGRLSEIFKEIEGRKVSIGCRSTAAREQKSRAKWLAVRELSAKRAVAIMAALEKLGVEPRNLAAASLSNKVEEDPMERGITVFTIAPSPRELPKYPDKP